MDGHFEFGRNVGTSWITIHEACMDAFAEMGTHQVKRLHLHAVDADVINARQRREAHQTRITALCGFLGCRLVLAP